MAIQPYHNIVHQAALKLLVYHDRFWIIKICREYWLRERKKPEGLTNNSEELKAIVYLTLCGMVKYIIPKNDRFDIVPKIRFGVPAISAEIFGDFVDLLNIL